MDEKPFDWEKYAGQVTHSLSIAQLENRKFAIENEHLKEQVKTLLENVTVLVNLIKSFYDRLE